MRILQSLLGFGPETLDLLFSRKRTPCFTCCFLSLLGKTNKQIVCGSVSLQPPGFICLERRTLIPEEPGAGWRAGCCLLLGMAVGWQRRVIWWYLGSLRAEPPLICRRMCFNRKNQSCPYLCSLAPAGAKSRRWLAGSGHRQRPGSVTPWVGGSCASPVQPEGSVWRLGGAAPARARFCNALCAHASVSAPNLPRRARGAPGSPLPSSPPPATRARPVVCLSPACLRPRS